MGIDKSKQKHSHLKQHRLFFSTILSLKVACFIILCSLPTHRVDKLPYARYYKEFTLHILGLLIYKGREKKVHFDQN